MGYQRAGFEVVGVDINEQPNYCGDDFVQFDALELLRDLIAGKSTWASQGWRLYFLSHFSAIHASPPCPAYSFASHYHGVQADHPDLIGPTRELLEQTLLPYVIENVEGAPLRRDLVLCGEMFGLRVHRHRIFETGGFFAMQPRHAPHVLKGALHNCHIEEGHARQVAGNYADHDDASDAMGIAWMDRRELANAIPPAYTEHIGGYLMSAIAFDSEAA